MPNDLTMALKRDPKNEQLWAQWYEDVYPKLYYMVYRLTRGDTDATREILQEALTRFVQAEAIDKVANHSKALGYLLTICRHVTFDRANYLRHTVTQSDLPTDAPTLDTPDREVEMQQTLERLDPDDQRLLTLAMSGLTVSEIAARFGLSYTNASVKLYRAKRRLRDSFS